jgi:hypothetical protein
MAANNVINLVGLDFDNLKASLVTYLKSQQQFKDYDFAGSNMNVLLDVLSHNTFKNAFYLNMVASEAFLDSAQLRQSVVSHSKELNYIPRSARSAKATLRYQFTNNAVTSIEIPKGTTYTTTVGFNLLTFVTNERRIISSTTGNFDFTLDIYEGQYVTDSFLVDDNLTDQRFILSNENIDTTSMTVRVFENDGNDIIDYTFTQTLLDVKSSSRVYFLQPAENNKYEIVFGNDIIGRKPKNSGIVAVEYRVSRGELGNEATKFTLAEDIPAIKNITPLVYSENNESPTSLGGASSESIESIKFNAPRHFQIQERAVTASDYEVMMKQKFPEINAISVYGGETVSPPRYGKVFVAVDISNVDGVPSSKKTEYYNFLKTRTPLSIDPIITEPEILYYSVNSTVKYNINVTDKKNEDIKSLVTSAVKTYNTTYLNDFNSTLYYSKLVSDIDDADPSIVSNDTYILLYKKLTPTIGATQSFNINFYTHLLGTNELQNKHSVDSLHSIRSTPFTYNGELVTFGDDGMGSITIAKTVGNTHTIAARVGTVDYETGKVSINNVMIEGYLGDSIKIYALPKDKDVSSTKNIILTVEDNEIKITVNQVSV